MNHAHSLFSDQNQIYQSVYTWFSENSDAISTRTYYAHFNWFTPFPVITQLEQDIRGMNNRSENGGMYVEGHHHFGTQGLTFYLLSKLLWDPYLNVEQLVNGYCLKAYGCWVAPFAKEYFYILQRKMDSLSKIGGNTAEIPNLLTAEVIAACNTQINLVEAKLGILNPTQLWRAELLISAWRNSVKFATAIDVMRNGTTPDCQAIIKDALEQLKAYADTDMGRWAFEHRVVMNQVKTDAVDFNLVEIPVGEHTWSDTLMYGGTLKFYEEHSPTISCPIWGYYLKSQSLGQIEIPLQADFNFEIKSVRCKFTRPVIAGVYVQAFASSPEIPEILVSSNPAVAFSLPEELMGSNKVKLILKYNNTSSLNQYVLTKGEITIEVVE